MFLMSSMYFCIPVAVDGALLLIHDSKVPSNGIRVYHKRLFGQSVQEAADLMQFDAGKTNSNTPDKGEFIIDTIMLFLKSYNLIIVT